MRRRTPLPHTRYRKPPGEKGVRTVVWEHQGHERAACLEVLSMLSCERSSMSPNDRELLERRPITCAPEQVSKNTNQPPHAAAAFPAIHIRAPSRDNQELVHQHILISAAFGWGFS